MTNGWCTSTIVAFSWSPTQHATLATDSQPQSVVASVPTRPPTKAPPRRSASAASVTRMVDSSGNVCFAGTAYRVGNAFRRRQVQVAVVNDTVEISVGEELIRVHAIRHDRTREHGASGQPRRSTSPGQRRVARGFTGTQVPEPLWNTGTGA